jgi:DNA-binding response OmpR family regulator
MTSSDVLRFMSPPFSMTARPAQVAALLLDEGGASMDRLIHMIWNDRNDDRIDNLVKVTVHLTRKRLKAAMGYDPIRTFRGMRVYVIGPDDRVAIRRRMIGE